MAPPGSSGDVETALRRSAGVASDVLRRLLAEGVDWGRVTEKTSPQDLVSDIDHAVEVAVRAVVAEELPHDAFLGEESGWQRPDGAERSWIVDPVDGTMNLVNGIPWACCSIGVMRDGEAIAGVVVEPYRGEMYLTTSPAAGVCLDGRPVGVAPDEDLAGRVVLLEVPSGASLADLAAVERAVLADGGTPRAMGSGALALAVVAAGRAHAVVHAGPSIWDVAAGVALVRHAGGVVLGPTSRYELGSPGPLVAANPAVAERLQAVLAQG